MEVKLTESQMATLKSMIEVSGIFADQILHIMRNSGMDKIDGSCLDIHVYPDAVFAPEVIVFGTCGKDSGRILLTKGDYNETFRPLGPFNSEEYELLFADETIREFIEKRSIDEKPLPPDGMWIGDNRNDPPLDDHGHEMKACDASPVPVGTEDVTWQ